jgi:enamine deaminase RidA (YjgF/YER057c/UK114 family)
MENETGPAAAIRGFVRWAITPPQSYAVYLVKARNRFFASVAPPAAPALTLVEVSKLYGPDFLIEIEAIAAV